MMSELRLTLLIAGVVFITALIWWERRRPRQANADGAERFGSREPDAAAAARPPREPGLALPEIRARDSFADRDVSVAEASRDLPSVPVLSPFAPLTVAHSRDAADPQDDEANGAAASFVPGALPGADAEASHDAETNAELGPAGMAAAPAVSGGVAPAAADALAPEAVREEIPRLPAGPSPVVDWPPDAQRRIVSLRLVATSERFVGRSLRQALAAEGFVLGRFAIFHKPDDEQRAVLSAASLTRPGTFDADTMDSQHFGGLSLFAVLPGPRPAPQAFEELISTARNLNDRLHGVLQDERGSPLTTTRIALLRERVSSESH
jgi:cell division protein ZipA